MLEFTIFRYFPFGGLQRDMLAIAQEAVVRGHQVTVFCGAWEGEKPKGVEVLVLSSQKWFGGNSVNSFVEKFEKIFQPNNYDVLVGFNKMPRLDFYFAGDSCFAQKAFVERHWLYRLTSRARWYLKYESAVFGSTSKTQILSIAETERKQFARFYSTAPERFCQLTPGISRSQFESKNPQSARQKIRKEFGIDGDAKVVLCLGSGFRTKGLDRSIAAFAALPLGPENKIFLLVVGADNPHRYAAQAAQLGVAKQVVFLGGRSDVADILQAADVLLHPAYRELAGNVILEAMLAGKPVVTTDVCGFAHYVVEYNMGAVVGAPYTIDQFVKVLYKVLVPSASVWVDRAQQFSATADVFSRQSMALTAIENRAQSRQKAPRESVVETQQKIIVLRDELIEAWGQEDAFKLVQGFSGPIAREFADRQTLRFEWAGRGYYRKLHRGVGWPEVFKNLLQLRLPVLGAKNEWLALNKLSALEIPSLEPVAFGEQKRSIARKISFLVTRELAGVVQLDHYFQQHKVSFKEKLILLQKVAEIAVALHSAGINHRDFYFCHFMLDLESVSRWRKGDVEPTLYLVDLHRAQLRHQVPKRWRIKDLAGLYFSSLDVGFTRTDYFRFMRCYWNLPLRDLLVKEKSLLERVALRAAKTYKRDFGLWPSTPFNRNKS